MRSMLHVYGRPAKAMFALAALVLVAGWLLALVGFTPAAVSHAAAAPMGAVTNTPVVPCSQFYFASSPNVGTSDNFLSGVAAVSANDAWAVGYYSTGSAYQTLAEHWDGTSWQVVPSPNGGPIINFLQGVSAVSANDVWAVGYYYTETAVQTLTMHWDGTA